MPAGRANRRLGLALAGLAALVVLATSRDAEAARGLDLGLTDGMYASANADQRTVWLDRTRDAGASHVLLNAIWRVIAPPTRPAGFDARDPANPAYAWGTLDSAVRDAQSHGLDVSILVGQAPDWAEGPHRPSAERAPQGTWKPNPAAIRDFAVAIATRYSGSFVDPNALLGGPLPRVTRFQLWAEPNLSVYLTPQWKDKQPKSAGHYRAMLNAFYEGINAANPAALVITGGTAPYGDPGRRGKRVQPGIFWRSLVSEPVRFDIAATNPINVGAPTRHAANREDISTPDIGKLSKILRKGRRQIQPGNPPIWATEVWWDSRPPDPGGIGLRQHARWLAQSFYVLWRQGVRSVTWFLIRDQARGGNFAATVQSGLYFRDGRAKPALRAFRFPFVGDRLSSSKVRVWGEAPRPGKVKVERKRGGGWTKIKRFHAGSNRVFTGTVHLRGEAQIRAVGSGETSLVWKQGAG